MTKRQFKSVSRVQQQPRSGMTLIELLVAVSILVIISAILVPQLRFASADRNIREASRTLASLFADASQRAINSGTAGVVIERNPNIVDEATGIAYAGTSMFILRGVPPYVGNLATDVAEYVPTNTADVPEVPRHKRFNPDIPADPFFIWIPAPFEEGVVQPGDQISFNNQPLRFNIDSVELETHSADSSLEVLQLQLSSPFNFVAGNIPPARATLVNPDTGSTASRAEIGTFIVHRQPRKLVSSRVDMPTGYLVDLRLSGELDDDSGENFFTFDTRVTAEGDPTPNSVAYLFNGRGAIDRFVFSDDSGNRRSGLPKEPVYLLVREYSTEENGERRDIVLSSEQQMWVTVEPTTGAANVVSGVGIDTSQFTTLPAALREARKLASQGQAAQ